MRTRLTSPVTLLILVAAIAFSNEAAAAEQDGSSFRLRLDLTELRRELARARLELNHMLAELGELRDFLAARDVEARIEQWRQEREELAAERRELAERRRELEEAAARVRAGLLAPPPPDPDRPRWELDYRIAAVPLDAAAAPVFVQPLVGHLLLQQFPNVDRRHVLVRGTFENRSAVPWRYTFEVRLADRSDQVIGRWRYQTPRLEPDDLHEFEMKVPVTDVARIEKYQIGNIEADDGPEDQ